MTDVAEILDAVERAAQTRIEATRAKDAARDQRSALRDTVAELSDDADQAAREAHRLLDVAIDNRAEVIPFTGHRDLYDAVDARNAERLTATATFDATTPLVSAQVIEVTDTELEAAYAEWDRRFAEYPELFDGQEPTDGRRKAEYLIAILQGDTAEWERTVKRFQVAINAAAWAIYSMPVHGTDTGTGRRLLPSELATARRTAARVIDHVEKFDAASKGA